MMNEAMKEIKAFDSASYEAVDLDSLVVYTAVVLEQLGVELSLENIIVGAFKLFPKSFSLLGYPEFPDATRVEKCLWRCRGKDKQWIGGKTPHGYLLTDKTRDVVAQTECQLSGTTLRKPKNASRMRRKDSLLKEVLSSPAYSKYINGEGESISQSEFCYLLQGTLDSSRETLRENLVSLKRLTEELQQGDILEFFNWLEQRFKNFLNDRRR
jgi:hypothetical protein